MPQRYPPLFALATWLQDWQLHLGVIVGAGLTFAFGPSGNKAVQLAFALMAIDVSAGLLKGLFWQSLCEELGWAGLRKRLAIGLFIAFGHQLDSFMGTGGAAKSAFAFIVCGQQAVSILKNVAAAGVMVPASAQQLVASLFKNAAEEATTQLDRTLKARANGEAAK